MTAPLGSGSEDVVFVGDPGWDVKAAGRLNLGAIRLTCGGISQPALGAAGALEAYGPAALLLQGLDGTLGKLARRSETPRVIMPGGRR